MPSFSCPHYVSLRFQWQEWKISATFLFLLRNLNYLFESNFNDIECILFHFWAAVDNTVLDEDRNVSRDSDGENRVATPTATESQLPWKRQGDEVSDAVQQNEFPAWASNKEYLAYNSPSATFLGKFQATNF